LAPSTSRAMPATKKRECLRTLPRMKRTANDTAQADERAATLPGLLGVNAAALRSNGSTPSSDHDEGEQNSSHLIARLPCATMVSSRFSILTNRARPCASRRPWSRQTACYGENDWRTALGSSGARRQRPKRGGGDGRTAL
jgi:hypothetical protein